MQRCCLWVGRQRKLLALSRLGVAGGIPPPPPSLQYTRLPLVTIAKPRTDSSIDVSRPASLCPTLSHQLGWRRRVVLARTIGDNDRTWTDGVAPSPFCGKVESYLSFCQATFRLTAYQIGLA
jgi:hypothetical protein